MDWHCQSVILLGSLRTGGVTPHSQITKAILVSTSGTVVQERTKLASTARPPTQRKRQGKGTDSSQSLITWRLCKQRQQGPSKVHSAAKDWQVNQNCDPKGRVVGRKCTVRDRLQEAVRWAVTSYCGISSVERDDGSQVVDASHLSRKTVKTSRLGSSLSTGCNFHDKHSDRFLA